MQKITANNIKQLYRQNSSMRYFLMLNLREYYLVRNFAPRFPIELHF